MQYRSHCWEAYANMGHTRRSVAKLSLLLWSNYEKSGAQHKREFCQPNRQRFWKRRWCIRKVECPWTPLWYHITILNQGLALFWLAGLHSSCRLPNCSNIGLKQLTCIKLYVLSYHTKLVIMWRFMEENLTYSSTSTFDCGPDLKEGMNSVFQYSLQR